MHANNHVHKCTCACTHIHTCIHTNIITRNNTHVYTHVHKHILLHIHTLTCMRSTTYTVTNVLDSCMHSLILKLFNCTSTFHIPTCLLPPRALAPEIGYANSLCHSLDKLHTTEITFPKQNSPNTGVALGTSETQAMRIVAFCNTGERSGASSIFLSEQLGMPVRASRQKHIAVSY
jgi:hypothetical protein